MPAHPPLPDPRWNRALAHAARREVLQEELLLRQLLHDQPDHLAARLRVAQILVNREEYQQALQWVDTPEGGDMQDPDLLLLRGQLQGQLGLESCSLQTFEALVKQQPHQELGWLFLGEVLARSGQTVKALQARFRALRLAQSKGLWLGPESTEPALVDLVTQVISEFRTQRRDWLFAVLDEQVQDHGRAELSRVETALQVYLGESPIAPSDPRQKPKFFYMPGLPDGPYHDPWLQPWTAALVAQWQAIRQEALTIMAEDALFESFLDLKPGQQAPEYVSGTSARPAWDAFFFYRHGQRFKEHHSRCPVTSAFLEGIELCRVEHQAPEICFSLLRAGSTIMPHYGVTNTRLVYHLPLVIPPGCALQIVDGPPHAWREGEPMMFDDTYQHGACNPSQEDRLILLMDCWNPHVRPPEKLAVKALVEAIDLLENRWQTAA
jgi:aspartate beta-hydroxylase